MLWWVGSLVCRRQRQGANAAGNGDVSPLVIVALLVTLVKPQLSENRKTKRFRMLIKTSSELWSCVSPLNSPLNAVAAGNLEIMDACQAGVSSHRARNNKSLLNAQVLTDFGFSLNMRTDRKSVLQPMMRSTLFTLLLDLFLSGFL